VKKGYTVETLPYNGQITYGNASNVQDLSKYKVFVVCEPNIVFTSSEKTAILNFVHGGGGLFMVSDHNNSDRNNDGWDSPHIWDDLMINNGTINDPFGMSFDYVDISQTSTNVANLPSDPLLHGPMGNVSEVMWSDGTTLTLAPATTARLSELFINQVLPRVPPTAWLHIRFMEAAVLSHLVTVPPVMMARATPATSFYDGWIADCQRKP